MKEGRREQGEGMKERARMKDDDASYGRRPFLAELDGTDGQIKSNEK